MAIKRQGPGSPRNAQRAVVAGVVGAAAFGALLTPAATASAAPVTVPGVGSVDVPDEVLNQIPPGAVPPGVLPPGVEIPGVDVPGASPESPKRPRPSSSGGVLDDMNHPQFVVGVRAGTGTRTRCCIPRAGKQSSKTE